MTVITHVTTQPSVNVSVNGINKVSVAALGTAYKVSGETFSGPYEVEPAIDATILKTKNKYMSDDVTLHGIRYSVTSNTSGGDTVYIGG